VAVFAAVAAVRLDAGAPADDTKDPEKPAQKDAPKDDPKKAEALNYSGKVVDKATGEPIKGAVVTVRRSLYGDPEVKEEDLILPPEQAARHYLYIELDAEGPGHAPQTHFGYSLDMIRKNEKMGGRPFFEKVELRPAKEVTGVVLAPDGKPAAGVKVMSYSADPKNRLEYGSFANARTDEKGRFSLMMITPGEGVFWVLPEKYALTTRVVNEKRGDVGSITLAEGVVISGKALDSKGKPVAGINVNAELVGHLGDDDFFGRYPLADSIRRSAVTDDKGEFTMGPLPAGAYKVQPNKHSYDASRDDRKARPLPGVFLPQKLTLKDGAKPEPMELRAVPHVVVEAQYYDSKGKTRRGHSPDVFGELDKMHWRTEARADADGKVTALVPHGLEKARLSLSTNEHGSLRWRKSKGDPLSNFHEIDLGTLNDDVKGIEIVRYTAPILLVTVKAKDGSKLKDAAVTAVYGEGKSPYPGRLISRRGRHSDVSFEHQEDGRFRSECLLPDEETTVTAHAEGYRSAPVKVKLEEGTTKEIELVVEPAADDKKEEEK
jgi:uncharacterized GH25 family protein